MRNFLKQKLSVKIEIRLKITVAFACILGEALL